MRARLIEILEPRCLLAADDGVSLDEEPQFVVHQPPRLQPGNVPLVGSAAFTGLDQIELLWQTQTIGTGTSDEFHTAYRRVGDSAWTAATPNPPIVTGVGTRMIHSATVSGLDWNTQYEYRVEHRRAEKVIAEFGNVFRTRLAAGDPEPFTFVAYGDSAVSGILGAGFQSVQRRINTLEPAFAVLLGDNIYEFGSHAEADARFTVEQSPPAVEWIAGHVDYFAIGNHDGVLGSGKASRESYSVPIPVKGVNAFAEPPAWSPAEYNYSWDFGNVHLVTFDSNPVELPSPAEAAARTAELLDYVVADLQASDATWKIVYTHHPLLGSEKAYDDPSSFYFQMALPRLRLAGADLILVGDSHTYSWTYPLTGYADANADGTIEVSEVGYVADNDRVYEKGAGLVQVISGVGGRSLRSHTYPDPFIAAGFSNSPNTGPIDYGFAQLDVTPDELTITYVSAPTGQIMGDTNLNGRADVDEPFFGQFRIRAARLPGDFDHNGQISIRDIDLLCAALDSEDPAAEFDLNTDARVDAADYDYLVRVTLQTRRGDANLDRIVNSHDLVQVFAAGKYNRSGQGTASWGEGDWNCDGIFDSADLVLMFIGGYTP
jgi:hypothetical protein